MSDVEIGGHLYRIGQMNAFDQIHVARRFAPVISSFFDILGAIPHQPEKDAAKIDIFEVLDSDKLDGLAKALAEMPDEQVEYVINKCASVCYRGEPDPVGNGHNFVPLWNKNAKRMQYELKSIDLLSLVKEVLQENLSGFFPTSR